MENVHARVFAVLCVRNKVLNAAVQTMDFLFEEFRIEDDFLQRINGKIPQKHVFIVFLRKKCYNKRV